MRYFQAQIKRTGRYFFPVCVTMGALILVLGLICGVQFTARFHSENRQKLKLAITGDASDDFFSLGSMFLRKWMPPVIPWNLFKWMKLRPKELWKTRKFPGIC